jgi:hypothetical protein
MNDLTNLFQCMKLSEGVYDVQDILDDMECVSIGYNLPYEFNKLKFQTDKTLTQTDKTLTQTDKTLTQTDKTLTQDNEINKLTVTDSVYEKKTTVIDLVRQFDKLIVGENYVTLKSYNGINVTIYIGSCRSSYKMNNFHYPEYGY